MRGVGGRGVGGRDTVAEITKKEENGGDEDIHRVHAHYHFKCIKQTSKTRIYINIYMRETDAITCGGGGGTAHRSKTNMKYAEYRAPR